MPTLTKKLPIDKPAINPIKVNVFTKNKSTFFARHKQLTPEGLIPEFIHDDAEATWVTDDDAQQFCQQNGINDFKGIVRDGNCFFRTILAALPEHPWSQHPDGHQILRERAVQYIRNNLTQFSLYYKETAPLENYLNRMEQPTQWAEGIIIEATALLLNITIDMIGLEKIANEIATTGRFTASEPRNALGKILMLRVNQNHYHLGGISWTQGEINRFSVCLSP